MSIETWKKEFLPSLKNAKTWTDKKCFQHVAKKYEGISPKNLRKHQVKMRKGARYLSYLTLYEDVLSVDECALCIKYHKPYTTNECKGCPLYRAEIGCMEPEETSLYRKVRALQKPILMVLQMEQMIEQCDKNGKWRKPRGSDIEG